MMSAATIDNRAAYHCIAAFATAAVLLLTGCATDSQGDGPAAAAADPGSEPAAETGSWDDPIWEAYGEEGENLEEIDGVAEDFPAEFPLPEGDLVLSMAGPGVWDMIFETDAPEQAEQIAERIREIVAQVDRGSLRSGEEGEYWGFSDDRYVVALEMRPGPTPPPMVAITVVER